MAPYSDARTWTLPKKRQVELYPASASSSSDATDNESQEEDEHGDSSGIAPRVRYATYKLYWAAGQQARALRLMGAFARRLEAEGGVEGVNNQGVSGCM